VGRTLSSLDGVHRDGDPPGLEQVYDDETLRALDGWTPARGAEPFRRPTTRGRVAGAMLTASALALRDLLEGEDPEGEPIIELDPADGAGPPQWVTYLHVPGAPQASRIVVRPWLAPSAA
jgi:hypothetical protein